MNPISKHHIAKSFSQNCKDYNKSASFHQLCAEKILNHLLGLKQVPKNILEIGSHTGILSHTVSDYINDHHRDYFRLDLHKDGETYIHNKSESQFIKGDGEQLPFLNNTFDCIISNATFQWFNNFETSLKKILETLTQNGTLIFSQFIQPSLEPLHTWYQTIGRHEAFLNLETIESLNQKCTKLGRYKIEKVSMDIPFENLKDMFRFLKNMGVDAPSKELPRLKRNQVSKLNVMFNESQKIDANKLNLVAAIVIIHRSEFQEQ